MDMRYFTLSREELISDVVALPAGRCVFAELELSAVVATGASPAVPDSVQLVVDVRPTRDDEFKELVKTPELTESGTVRVEIPSRKEPYEANEYPPVIRARVVHKGRIQQRYFVRFVGL